MSEIRAFYDPMHDKFALWMRDGDSMAEPVQFTKFNPGAIREPMLRFETAEGQQFIDALWQAGFRPTAGKQSEGVTAAQARHLDDMRQIAFAKLNVEKPS